MLISIVTSSMMSEMIPMMGMWKWSQKTQWRQRLGDSGPVSENLPPSGTTANRLGLHHAVLNANILDLRNPKTLSKSAHDLIRVL